MARQLNSIQVKRTSEALEQILRYRIMGDKKSSLTGIERILQGG